MALRARPTLMAAPGEAPADMADSTDYYGLRFGGVHRLFGPASAERLRAARVLVVGLGGVGSWSVEALARSGVGSLVLVDPDEVCVSNINRQLPALCGSVGRPKATELAARVREINPDCHVHVRQEWVTEENALELVREEAAGATGAFAVLDATDGVREKAALIRAAHACGAHLLTVGAAGGKADPTAVRRDDLTAATYDALLRSVRRHLRKAHGFPSGKRWATPCVYSTEPGRPAADGDDCDRFGTACFATGAFGFAAAAAVVEAIARGEEPPKPPSARAHRAKGER